MPRQSGMSALEKEWKAIEKREQRLAKLALQGKDSAWKGKLEEKVPPKVSRALEAAFCKAFALVFEKGTGIIEKSYDSADLRQAGRAKMLNGDYVAQDAVVIDVGINVDENGKLCGDVDQASMESRNLLLTTVEGIGLGALGIGLPDIVLFVGMLLKGIYETALRYGFSYDTPEERLWILKAMEASLTKGSGWLERNQAVDQIMAGSVVPDQEALKRQRDRTAQTFAMDMLLLKFVQGLPLVGVLGGAGNPVYYRRVLRYVALKYRKRYLFQKREELAE